MSAKMRARQKNSPSKVVVVKGWLQLRVRGVDTHQTTQRRPLASPGPVFRHASRRGRGDEEQAEGV